MAVLVPAHAGYDIPAPFERVAEPGGIVMRLNPDGSRWRPADADLSGLGVHIITTPTDNRIALRLEDLHMTPIHGGTVFSRKSCSQMRCIYEAAFVPVDQAAKARTEGVFTEQLIVDAKDEARQRAAGNAIRFMVSGSSASGFVRLDDF